MHSQAVDNGFIIGPIFGPAFVLQSIFPYA